MKLAPELVREVMSKNQSQPEEMIRKLRGLKSISQHYAPSPLSSPLEFQRYYDFVERTKGKEEADRLKKEQIQQLGINQMKSQMIPSVR
jgi:hypothetical protein